VQIVSLISARDAVKLGLCLGLLSGCATPAAPPTQVALQTVEPIQPQAQPHLYKRKIAVGRFTNETRYGRALLTGDELDPLGRQVSDVLSARLTDTGRFLVFERPDLGLVQAEQALTGDRGNIVGVDVLLVGSLTGFAHDVQGENGFLSNTKKQIARATVDIRLVDTHTARVLFAATGHGEATIEDGTVMGFGSQAAYAGSLNDRAISAAITDVMTPLVSQLSQRAWRTDILKVADGQVYISGGLHQGVKPGDHLAVMRAGGVVRSAQSGFGIALPGTQIATLQVEQNFGDDETSEGSVCSVLSGSVPTRTSDLFVTSEPGA
jgi:curli biogenesis system outer membrane secretion channel CsgG